ncbi:MAG: glycoside hydrolase [Bacteroidales bacterium]|nr:glycoside hydrolase [Bacteroidales bacterium]
MSRALLFLLLVALTAGNLSAQNYRKNQEAFLDAEYFLMFEDYSDALPYYLQLFEEYPDNYNLAYRIGLCYLNITGEKNMAVNYLESAARNSSALYSEGSLKQKTAPYEAWFYLANAYRINYQFDLARETFKKYSETLLPDDTENILFIQHQIEVCNNAKILIRNPVKFAEKNMGEFFNDSYSNFNPVISSDGQTFAYMSSLKFYDAVFIVKKIKNRWSSPINITPDIQSDGDLYISCLADNGNTLYLSKDDDNNSDIYISKFDGVKWSVAEKLGKTINTKHWETHAFVTDNGNTMVLASNRPGGYGGLDLYISVKMDDNTWGDPVNMGPEINTPFNEDRAFLPGNGSKLFFASQGHHNMGGFDLFKSEKQQNGQWSEPVNLGYPVNTPDNNTYFMPADNGKSGYMPVYKKGSGFGREDIYFITFK